MDIIGPSRASLASLLVFCPLDLDSIKPDDNFLRLGGDLIAAIKLVSTAREQGLLLSAADIFRQSMLHRMAGMVSKLLEGDAVVAPFALLQEPHDVTWTEAATAYKVETAVIKDCSLKNLCNKVSLH